MPMKRHGWPRSVHTTDLRSALHAWATQLEAAEVPTPTVDAELIAGHVLGMSRGELEASAIVGRTLSARETAKIDAAVARRAQREPLQHILGVAYFIGLELHVGPGVFVPRPETELLVMNVLAHLPHSASVVELGTGSAAIALALATARPDIKVDTVERDPAALEWARRNIAEITDADTSNVTLIEGSFYDDALMERLLTAADVLVSNPPYVPLDAPIADVEVREYDPRAAVYSGPDGLDDIRHIVAIGSRYLPHSAQLWLEHDESQGAAIRELLHLAEFQAVATLHDLVGRDRFTYGQR